MSAADTMRDDMINLLMSARCLGGAEHGKDKFKSFAKTELPDERVRF